MRTSCSALQYMRMVDSTPHGTASAVRVTSDKRWIWAPCRFFGRGGFGFGGGDEEEEEQTPKGNDVVVGLEATLRDLYLGASFKVGRGAAVSQTADSPKAQNRRRSWYRRMLLHGVRCMHASLRWG